MKTLRACLAAILALTLLLPSIVLAKPCGSDGPIPFINMTGSITLPVKSIQSVGAVQEFAYWESQDALVYRNDKNMLRVSYFGSGVDTPLAKLAFPLSKLVDPTERFLTTDDASYFFNASTAGPLIKYAGSRPAPTKLYWQGSTLYLVEYQTPFLGYPYFEVSTYYAGDKSAKQQCTYQPPSGTKLFLADGHAYPDVYLYQVVPLAANQKVIAFYKMNVHTCGLTPMGLPTEPILGNITEVHRFPTVDAFAVRTDDSVKNFRWEMGGRCEYLAIGQEEVMIPNHDRPLAVTWTSNQGLALYNLETKIKADAFRGGCGLGIDIGEISAEDLWVPRHASDLLLSPELEKIKERRMLTVDVEQILPVSN